MARIEIDPNYSSPTFSRATAPADIFKKEDVQNVAAALSTHDHTAGKGLGIGAAAIPNGSVTLAKLAADSVDSSKILDGSITTADLANASVTNAKLASDSARANLLVDGGFEVWQRGNGPFTVSGAFTADQWSTYNGTSTLSISKTTLASATGAVLPALGGTFTFAGGASGVVLQKVVLSGALSVLKGRQIAFSVWALSINANALRIAMASDGTGGVQTNSAFAPANTATLLTLLYTVPNDATFINVQVAYLSATTTFAVTNAMLVVGSVPADYAPLHPADDLARCLRYYEAMGTNAYYPLISGYSPAGATFFGTIFYKVPKAVSPTVTKNGTWSVSNCAQPTILGGDTHGTVLQSTATALGYALFHTASVGATLTIESNP